MAYKEKQYATKSYKKEKRVTFIIQSHHMEAGKIKRAIKRAAKLRKLKLSEYSMKLLNSDPIFVEGMKVDDSGSGIDKVKP